MSIIETTTAKLKTASPETARKVLETGSSKASGIVACGDNFAPGLIKVSG